MKVLVTLTLLISTQLHAQQYLISGVNIVTVEEEGILRNQDILIENGMIVKIGRKLPAGKKTIRIDGRKKYVIPGLFDMHAHFYYEQGNNKDTSTEELKLMLANGLTTVRIANGDSLYLEIRNAIRDKKRLGPELVVTSPQLVGVWNEKGKVFGEVCKTPEEGRSAVYKFQRLGYDQIKLTTMIQPDVYDAIVEAAKAVNIQVVGHVGPLVKLPRALAAHQQVEHMDEFIDMLLPDTSYNHGQSVSDMNLWRKQAWATVPYLDESKIPALVKQVKASGIYVTPTNHFFYSFFGKTISDQDIKTNPGFPYAPAAIRKYAYEVREMYQKRLPPESSRKKYLEIRRKMIVSLWQAGVPLMAGSDSPQWFAVTGFALHDEIENLVSTGMTPFAALQTATIHPARFLGVDKRTGSIAEGKEADLVLLDKNPLTDIRNARSIRGVFSGTWYDRVKLDKLLKEAKKLAE